MTYLVEQGRGYVVRDEIHQNETYSYAWCCNRTCAVRYMRAAEIVPMEVVLDHPLGHGAGQYIDLRESDPRSGDAPIVSWGDWPCADSPSHEYCPACGSLTIHGSEDGDEYGRSCDGETCTWPEYVDPDPCMALARFDVDGFVGGYLDGILFTESLDAAGYAESDDTSLLSHGCSRDDFSPEAIAEIRAECVDFLRANLADVERYCELRGDPVRCSPDSFGRSEYSAAECAGTDFWLSRNGHGAGFFDCGNDPVFTRLQDAARVYGETYVQFDGETITT